MEGGPPTGEPRLSYDRQTVNVLILELATMVVAIAIAFGANFLTTFFLSDILYFVFATSLVIWFWWGYVMDRLEFPPKSDRFPVLDVLVLILIALIPFALRQREISAISGTLAAVLFAWALLIRGIVRANADSLSAKRVKALRGESALRMGVGLMLVLDAVVGTIVPAAGVELLYLAGIVAVGWTALSRRSSRRESSRGHP
jgi:hypothetical protein